MRFDSAHRMATLILWVVSVVLFNVCQDARGADPNPVKHVILMIGDGMGGWHVDATRKYLGKPLAMTSLTHTGYMTTFARNPVRDDPLDRTDDAYWDEPSVPGSYDPARGGRTPWDTVAEPDYLLAGATDSAAAASAMANGHKTFKYALNAVPVADGYNPSAPYGVHYYPTIVDFADSACLATGLVTSVPFNHATPAAFVVKHMQRRNHGEKAQQLAHSNVDVIMGCGHPFYDENGRYRVPDFGLWSRNKSRFLPDAPGAELYRKVVNGLRDREFLDDKADFDDLADGDGRFRDKPIPNAVFGLARVARTLQQLRGMPDDDATNDWQVGGQRYNSSVPDLAIMARGALAVLSEHPNGFFLMVEGGAVDWASHASNTTRMIEEMIAFDTAVKTVIDWVDNPANASRWENTLLIVTADHECGCLQPIGNYFGDDVIQHARWGLNGKKRGSHTNSLVPIYARGPGARFLAARFKGDYRDNTDIFYCLRKAMKPG